MKRLTLILVSLLSTGASAKQPCVDNFTVDGNPVLGKVYATEGHLSHATPSMAFDATLAYVAANGFTVDRVTKTLGKIHALETDSIGRRQRIDLNVMVEPDSYNRTRFTINYILHGDATLTDDQIKQLFCNTFAAVDLPLADQPAEAPLRRPSAR